MDSQHHGVSSPRQHGTVICDKIDNYITVICHQRTLIEWSAMPKRTERCQKDEFSLKRVCSLPYQTMHCNVSKNVPKTVSKYIFNMYFSHYQHKRAISLTPIELGLNLFGKTALRVVEACSQQRIPGHPKRAPRLMPPTTQPLLDRQPHHSEWTLF